MTLQRATSVQQSLLSSDDIHVVLQGTLGPAEVPLMLNRNIML